MSNEDRDGRVLDAAFLLQAVTSLAGGILLDFFLVVHGKIQVMEACIFDCAEGRPVSLRGLYCYGFSRLSVLPWPRCI